MAISLSVPELVPPCEVFPVVMDIQELSRQGNIKLECVRRSANKVAHQVASLAAKRRLPPNWVSNPLSSLVSLLLSDVSLSAL